jgi:methylthioribose-1-phosphate isomerase
MWLDAEISQAFRTIRDEGDVVVILDQTALPHHLVEKRLATLEDVANAIRTMQVRGAPLIGATAAYGLALAMRQDPSDTGLKKALATLELTRPTAVNLRWALNHMHAVLAPMAPEERAREALLEARAICAEDAATNHAIGEHGLRLIENLAREKQDRVGIMTHCNAGWLATVAYGTALALVYAAHSSGIKIHVFVSETRPRNQGLLTEWELRQAGIESTLIADNAAGHFLQRGDVDMVLVGADRIAANGDVANKVGTYLKALAAHDNQVPFYVAAPVSSIDFGCVEGRDIPIEERDPDELRLMAGLDSKGRLARIALAPYEVSAANPAFDVTPAHLIHGILCERGIIRPRDLRTKLAP